MALVTHIQEGHKEKEGIHKKTECTCYITWNKKNEKFLQFETYGSADRENPGKVSQSIQFSPGAIKELKTILEKHFSHI